MKLKILTHPNPVLRQKAKEVEINEIKTEKLQKLIEDMIKTMQKADGIGLAAPQIGQSLRIFIAVSKDGPLVFINPKTTKHSWRKSTFEEGCLSIPGVFGMVKRPRTVWVEFLDQSGQKQKLKAEELFSHVVQHEIDHLNGVLFVDKMKK